jgi:taurine dioxygenase
MRLRPLHPAFGVEVLDVDPLNASAGEIEQIRAALDAHQMLLFRGQGRIAPEQHVEIVSWFGEPAGESDDGALWTVLCNENAAGAARLEFHSDQTYTDHPIELIALHPIELPPGPTATAFISSQAAWGRLPHGLKARLEGLTLRHRLAVDDYGDWPEFVADHPMRLTHPRTGRPVLLVTEHHAHRVLGLGREDSDALLGELFGYLYSPSFTYLHQWALHDLLIWDNLAIQHSRPEEAVLAKGRRTMQRVALCDASLDFVIAAAREREAQGHPAVDGRR